MTFDEVGNIIAEISCIPFTILFIGFLCNKWKISRKRVVIISTVFSLILMGLNIALMGLYKADTFFYSFVYLFNTMAIFIYLYSISDLKLEIFLYIFASGVCFEFAAANLSDALNYFCDIPSYLLKVLFYMEIALLIKVFFKNTFYKVAEILGKDWLFRTFMPMIFLFSYILNDAYYYPKLQNTNHMVSSVIITILLCFNYVVTYRSFRLFVLSSEKALLAIKKAASGDYIKRQTEIMTDLDQEIHTIRHDLRHSIKHLATTIESGDTDRALKELSDFDSDLDITTVKSKTIVYTGIVPFDALLSYYANMCSKKGIHFCVDLSYFEKYAPTIDTDLIIVFTNALDNALEAAEKSQCDDKFIKINDYSNGNNIIIEFSNTCTDNVVFNEAGLPIATKSGHGFGIRSIKEIIESMGGSIDCSLKNNKFKLIVFK